YRCRCGFGRPPQPPYATRRRCAWLSCAQCTISAQHCPLIQISSSGGRACCCFRGPWWVRRSPSCSAPTCRSCGR
ncbi:unnamed protein product, partial [Laminaria digitata]